MTYYAAASYPCDPETPGRARAWALGCIREALEGTAGAMLLDDAALVVSELTTNAMRTGGRSVTLGLTVDPGHLRVAVTDHVPGRPNVHFPGPEDVRGRGLQVVAALASQWGVTELNEGKEVWAELSLIRARAM
jgi:anti-sigma regulatory factor (Ser/Thr protein kinase)